MHNLAEQFTNRHFLITYDRKADHPVELREFGTDTERALDAYEKTEKLYRDQPNIDIFLLGSDSLESMRKTHGNYFDDEPRFRLEVDAKLFSIVSGVLQGDYDAAQKRSE